MADTTYADEGEYVPKAYQFERDTDVENLTNRQDALVFDRESNIDYVYTNANNLIDTEQGKNDLEEMIEHFLRKQLPRLQVLDDYSKGLNTTVLSGRRRTDKNKSDQRIRHNYANYVSEFLTSYVMGNPVTIESADKGNSKETVTLVGKINRTNETNELNKNLAYDASRYGRAFELHVREKDTNYDRIYLIDPKEIFVIRSADVEKSIIAAVHLPDTFGKRHITVYTDKNKVVYEPINRIEEGLSEKGRKRHDYEDVQVIEWRNNRFRSGDWESEISIIDAYDSAQSDTGNYMNDLADALLVIAGDFEAMGLDPNEVIEMKNNGLLALQSGTDINGKQTNINAEYIYKQYDTQGTEAYKKRLLDDYFKLTSVPNFNDERTNADSGVALERKFVNLQQKRATKESQYAKALKQRYNLIESIHINLNDETLDSKVLELQFHPNVPEDRWGEAERAVNAGTELSQETLHGIVSFTTHENEKERLRNEEHDRRGYSDEMRRFMTGGLENEPEG